MTFESSSKASSILIFNARCPIFNRASLRETKWAIRTRDVQSVTL